MQISDLSFPKEERLLKRYEFQSVLDGGSKIVNSYIIVVGKPISKGQCRLGIIASKKVGNAVVRNKIKRCIRESFRLIKHQFTGLDIVVIARSRAKSVPSSVVKFHLEMGIKKISQNIL